MASANLKTVNDPSFESEVLKSDIPVLVHFGATWCGPCKALNPVIDKLADELKGKAKVCYVDIDDASETSRRFGIKSVPACLVFRGGQKTGQFIGLTTRDKLIQLLAV